MLRTENFRRTPEPRATHLATVNAGTELSADSTFGRWVRVALDGWIWARSLEETEREGFDRQVGARNGENLRAEPNGRIVARLDEGALVDEIERRPGWVHVRRWGWMYAPSLEPLTAPPPRQTAAAQATSRAPPASEDSVTAGSATSVLDHAVIADSASLRRTADGPAGGRLDAGTPVRVLARSGDWVRVQVEGWVREDELRTGAPGVLVGVTGAEVRARPADYVGKLVQWNVQFIAVQNADELRREIPAGQRYLLVRGPLPETGFVYVIPTPEQLSQIERLPPLAELTIVGRVRAARSQYVGNPVLALEDFAVRR